MFGGNIKLRKNLTNQIETALKTNQIKQYSFREDNKHLKIVNHAPFSMDVDNGIALILAKNYNRKLRPLPLSNETDHDFDFITKTRLQVNYEHADTFHRAIYPIMIFAQCCSIMPLTGIWNTNPYYIRFSFKSPQMLITLLFMCISSVLTFSMLRHVFSMGVNAKNFVGVVFFTCAQCACILFIILAKRWPHLIRYWTRTEWIFAQPPYEMPKPSLAKRIQRTALTIIVLSLIEHALYLTSTILSYKREVAICSAIRNVSATATFDEYITQSYDFVFEKIPYNLALAIIFLIGNACCTFIWNYMDLFIVMISKGISYRFEQLTARIQQQLTLQDVTECTFVEIRKHYVKLCELLERIDDQLANIILLSCINNLYFVCYQLLYIFNKLRWPINYIYYWYSLLYLIGRTAFVFLTAAAIDDESRAALSLLRCVSSKAWSVEVERLIYQMSTQTVALSGRKFYFLTRRLLFGMAGTIVTYELVLLQFDEPNRARGLQPLCA